MHHLSICGTGVHPYWIGDLDSIILKNPELRNSYRHANGAIYEKRKSLSHQLDFGHTKTQVSVLYVYKNQPSIFWCPKFCELIRGFMEFFWRSYMYHIFNGLDLDSCCTNC